MWSIGNNSVLFSALRLSLALHRVSPGEGGAHSSEGTVWGHQVPWDVFLIQLHEKQNGIVTICRDCTPVCGGVFKPSVCK
jgi:hypothetical protein